MILSGPKACRGSTNDARILPHFLHSAVKDISSLYLQMCKQSELTRHRRRERIMDSHVFVNLFGALGIVGSI